ncbi:MAG: 2-dehydropantoate 2-reductase [Chloroflexi bacterium HGW-Chloroflexi-1]|nr:MAG: 2-dehydropantoate 2-reductase [Chloroflexi bacterium HGW-Chloroflexi-1]
MRVLVIGAGAVGSLLGARLALAGHAVTLVGRPALVEAVRGRGLTLIEPDGCRRAAEVAVVGDIAAAFAESAHKPGFSEKPGLYPFYDLALVTVKAYDTATVIVELTAATRTPPPLLTLQNGVGNEEALAAAVGADRVLAGALNTPVSVPAPGHVQVHRPTYKIGLAPVAAGAAVDAVAAALTGAGFTVGCFADYRGLKWTKLLMNILANASSAILDWTPAQVMADPVASRLEAGAWQEALAVMAASAIRPVALAGYPFPLLAPLARRLPVAWLARGLRGFVAGGRGSKMPSLHAALNAGKRSEVGWLNGAVTRYGREAGVATPINARLTDILTASTEGRAVWDDYRGRPERLEAGL